MASIVAAAVAAPLAGSAQATHAPCGFQITPAGVRPTVVAVPGGFYLDIRELAADASADHLYSVWVYQESNGTAGLQRGGKHAILGDAGADAGFAEPCQQSARPDAYFF